MDKRRKPAARKLYSPKAERKIHKVMKEFGEKKLHSGSKKGPIVTSPKQAIAIGIAEARKKGEKAGELWKRKERKPRKRR